MVRHVNDRYKRFWKSDNLTNIGLGTLVQGDWDIKKYLRELKTKLRCNTIVDFGCGYGRLFEVFKDVPMNYFGIDLNPSAINEARKRHPQFRNRFVEVDITSAYAKADMFLAFTVFLHMDDDTLTEVARRIYGSCTKYLVVIEALGREWRPDYDFKDNPMFLPLYNREKEEYVELLGSVGFKLKEEDSFLNPHYAEQEEYEGFNCYTNVLIFGKV
jgi:SAM-dependent methyltransferase